jgi:hypothetical protein
MNQASLKLPIQKPVWRIPFIEQKTKGRIVLDIGAYDETAATTKGTDWLHGRIAKVAKEVVGVDNSTKLQKETRFFPNAVMYKHTFESFAAQENLSRFDIVIAGEFIEHLDNTLAFLSSVKKTPGLSGKTLILSTPNATSLHNVLLALIKKESAHPDHLQVYSYKTLATILQKAGFTKWRIFYYHVSFPEYLEKQKGFGRILALLTISCIHFLERCFPMLSGGLIVEVEI